MNSENFDWIIMGGDWITNTPPLPSFLETSIIYIAHELKREFYEVTSRKNLKYIKQFIWKLLIRRIKNWEKQNLNKCKFVVVNSIFSATN